LQGELVTGPISLLAAILLFGMPWAICNAAAIRIGIE